jgi:PST family polysaccharide transporter
MAGKGTAAALFIFWKPLPFRLPRRDEVLAPIRFGFQVAVSRLAWAAYSQSDAVIIGRVLGQSALGSYRLAMSIASAPAEKIGMLIMRVTGPLFSTVQKDEALVKRYFLFVSDGLALMIFPLAAGLIVVAPEVTVVLGPQWKAAVGPIQWLAGFLALRMLNSLASQVLVSLRFAKFSMWMALFTAAIMPAAFFIAAPHGVAAVALTWFVMSPVILLPPMLKLFRAIHCTFREYLMLLSPAILSSLGTAVAVVAAKRWIIPAGYAASVRLLLETAVGGACYAAILLVFYRPLVRRYFRFAVRMRAGPGIAEPAVDIV